MKCRGWSEPAEWESCSRLLDRSLDRMVAIKVLSPHLAASGAARQRFAREAKAAAAVLHPNVIAIHGVSSGDDGAALPYLVVPYVRGSSLQVRIDAEGPLGVTEILRIAIQIAEGLAAAHSQGLVHRDIKPANILLEESVERVAITDFGLARAVDDATLTHSGVVAGTPQYMSPEQARGEAIDFRSDLFSLGSVMYAMCAGRPPFRAETSYGILRRITDMTPRPIREINPEIPSWLCRLVARLHEKSPRGSVSIGFGCRSGVAPMPGARANTRGATSTRTARITMAVVHATSRRSRGCRCPRHCVVDHGGSDWARAAASLRIRDRRHAARYRIQGARLARLRLERYRKSDPRFGAITHSNPRRRNVEIIR